ncbi:MAG: response regulator [Polyangiaceae bacterium]|nr:response regulator [Polyangiaceae bacterium]
MAQPELLLVEDDAVVARSVVRALRSVPYEVSCAATLAEARRRLDARVYRALVLDLGLPDGHGLELARELRLGGRPMPIVVYSGQIDRAAARAIAELRAIALPKPATGDALRRALTRATALEGAGRTPTAHAC